jgi:ribose transport system permease protein
MGKNTLERLRSVIKKNEFVSMALCLTLVIVLTAGSGVFWSRGNFESLQSSIAPTSIIAFGMMLLLVCGYFDLSVGSIMLLAGLFSGRLALAGAPLPVILAVVLLSGFLIGCLNGYCVAVLRINALIVTIGTQQIGYGVAMSLLAKVRKLGKFSPGYIVLGEGKFLGLYYMTWIALILLLAFSYYLKWTPSGRKLYFVGGNREASRLIGFNDRRIVFFSYAITGFLASLAGILVSARIQSPSQYTGGNVHMTCIIACVVGGGSFSGGKGSALGALLGVAFMSLLTNMFNLFEMKVQLQNVVVGLILVAVITIDGYLHLKKMRELGKL